MGMAAAAAAQVGGTVLQSVAGYQAAEAEAAQARRNGYLARQAAVSALGVGAYQAGQARMRGTATVADATVAAAANGVDVGSSAVQDANATTRAFSEMDARTIANNALREALGYRSQASNFDQAAKMAHRGANMSLLTGAIGAFASAARYGSGTGGGTGSGSELPTFGKGSN